MFLSEDEVLVG